MRQIKFRGIEKNSNELVYGDLIHGVGSKEGKMYILPRTTIYPKGCHSLDGWDVFQDTVGQFSNLPNEIWEHDIIQSQTHKGAVYVVVWNEINACFSAINTYTYELMKEDELMKINVLNNSSNIKYSWIEEYQFEPIGNIHQHPELLNVEI